MAGEIIAYNEITILDLIDTATYIYYSENEDGSGATTAPTATTKYIGIYSGPPVESGQPDTDTEEYNSIKDKIVWSKYTGEDGAPGTPGQRGTGILKITSSLSSYTSEVGGVTPSYRVLISKVKDEAKVSEILVGDIIEHSYYHYPVIHLTASYVYCGERQSIRGSAGAAGNGITSTVTEYAASTDGTNYPTSGWQPAIPSLSPGEFLWVKTTINYTSGDPSVSYSVSYSGKDSNIFRIATNQKEILRIYSQRSVSYSPFSFNFEVYKKDSNGNEVAQDLLGKYTLEYQAIEADTNKIIFKTVPAQYLQINNNENSSTNILFFSVDDFYSSLPTDLHWIGEEKRNFFRFTFEENNERAYYVFESKVGAGEDLAKFNMHAGGFNASIQETKLDFSGSGLSIMNGGIKIFKKHQYSFSETTDTTMQENKDYYEKDEESENEIYYLTTDTIFQSEKKYYERGEENTPSFWADEQGNLHLEGTLEGASGTFTGAITAEEGTIGGLTIFGSELFSGKESNTSPLKISGDGTIYAKKITLGDNAKIESQIQLGNAYIKNPALNENKTFLEAGRFTLSDQGKLILGEIELYGGDTGSTSTSYIKAGTENTFWQINGDGTAKFKEIVVDKATIQNSILEINSIQAVGSLMLFKDSWKVKSIDGKKAILESPTKTINLKVGELITNGNEYFEIDSILEGTEENEKIIQIKKGALNSGDNITKIGRTDDFLLTILGDSTGERDYAVKNSLTISQIDEINSGKPTFKKVLVLGDLTSIDANYKTGLYAENVFLNGTLTTVVNNSSDKPTYAGVNTLSGAAFNKFDEFELDESGIRKPNSKIVFWAGSQGNKAENIQSAPFQVTEAGSLYANKGRFEGSLITNSIIKGASIHTAKIYGEGNDTAALKIYDANKGIEFIKKREESEEIAQLGINAEGLYNESTTFINLQNGVSYTGTSAKYFDSESTIFIQPNFVGFGTGSNAEQPNWKINSDKGIQFLYIGENNQTIFEINPQVVKSTQKVNFEQGVVFGKETTDTTVTTGVMEYQKTNNGYNLYVR